ncbi:hypothetical protein BGY98DRAFT_218045 [Russula aff. rugulosa BPL654]|nr:hypothetical protein BGY98DRAFT_218045 [Russula aff. rugulosa BPL654]
MSRYRSISMSAYPLQASPTSFQTHGIALSQQLAPGHLELCIYTDVVGLYPQPPAHITSDELADSAMTAGPPSNTASPSVFTCLLSGALDEFLPYIGQEQSKWLIDISHDICDPTLKRGLLKVWDASGERWRDVNLTDPPTASTYLYVIWAAVSLTKISERTGKSKTSSGGNAFTMANRVKERDRQQCWVTGSDEPIMNSHVCPKRMGDHLLRVIYNAFVSTPPPALSIYDEICGITLCGALYPPFDTYEFGLRLVVAPDE